MLMLIGGTYGGSFSKYLWGSVYVWKDAFVLAAESGW